MSQTSLQRRASDRVAAWLSENERNPSWLVRATGADPGTIGDFLNGKRWPKTGTQGKIEHALGWPPGAIRVLADGGDPWLLGWDLSTRPRAAVSDALTLTEASDAQLLAEIAMRLARGAQAVRDALPEESPGQPSRSDQMRAAHDGILNEVLSPEAAEAARLAERAMQDRAERSRKRNT